MTKEIRAFFYSFLKLSLPLATTLMTPLILSLLILSPLILSQGAYSQERSVVPVINQEDSSLSKSPSPKGKNEELGSAACTVTSTEVKGVLTRKEIYFQSLSWQGTVWSHRIVMFMPEREQYANHTYLLVSGSGNLADEEREVMQVASQHGVSGVVLSDIPNQPMLGNRKEDKLLAYTFHRFFENGDPTIPALVPMKKAVSRAMDCISMIIPPSDNNQRQFILSGASKRGWTTWLVGLSDERVVAIAPRVFEMINISEQLKWAQEKNGAQSDKLRAYTEFGLTERIDEPRGRELLKLIDPFESIGHREPAVLSVIGANDPYWLIDSSQHYWNKVLGQKAMIVVPNVGHHLGKDKIFTSSLIAWIGKVLRSEPIPTMSLTNQMGTDMVSCTSLDVRPQKISLWYADSANYDFRDSIWLEQPMNRNTKENKNEEWCGKLPPRCSKRYCAYFTMAHLQGGSFPISTPPKVFSSN